LKGDRRLSEVQASGCAGYAAGGGYGAKRAKLADRYVL